MADVWTARLDAAPKWRVLETSKFTVVSQISETETRAWAEEFNQFIEATKSVLKVENGLLPKLTVVIFDREKDFAAYRPLGTDGKAEEWVGAYFGQNDTWSVVGLPNRWEDQAMRRLIFQGGVYWLLSADQRRYPTWCSVGLAQLFSTFRVSREKAIWGEAFDEQVRFLNRRKLMPLQQLLLTSQTDKGFNDDEWVNLFYAQSWAFMHYLIFGQRKDNHATLSDFLTAFYSGMSTEDAFKKTFGMDYAAMESALDGYLGGGQYRVSSFPLASSAMITAPFMPASPALVQVALAKLAYSSRGRESAQKHAEEAVRLDPTYADGYKMLAWVRLADGTPDGFLSAAEKAIQLGAKDADALYLLARARTQKALSLGGIPAPQAREISNLFERTINLSPTLKTAYINLASALSYLDEFNEQDSLFLDQGLKLFPDVPALLAGRAQLLRKKGNKAEALKILQALCDEPGRLTPEERKNYRKVKASWDASDTLVQADELLRQKQPKEALVLLDGLLQRDPPIEARNAIVQMRVYAEAAATLQDAKVARSAGQLDEAARLYQSVVDMERAPAQLRGSARQALQKLQRTAATEAVPAPTE